MNASKSASVIGTDFRFGEESTIDAVWDCGARGMGIKIEEIRALRADEVVRRGRTTSCDAYRLWQLQNGLQSVPVHWRDVVNSQSSP